MPPGGGVFVVMNAVTGQPCGIFQENRFMTDLRTGAGGKPHGAFEMRVLCARRGVGVFL